MESETAEPFRSLMAAARSRVARRFAVSRDFAHTLYATPCSHAESRPASRIFLALRSNTRNVAWNASSASASEWVRCRHTAHTNRPCRRTSSANAASFPPTNRRSNSPSLASGSASARERRTAWREREFTDASAWGHKCSARRGDCSTRIPGIFGLGVRTLRFPQREIPELVPVRHKLNDGVTILPGRYSHYSKSKRPNR